MTNIAVAFDVSRLRQDLIREQRSLARTVRRAVNALAYGARDAIKADMARTFDRPTPYTLNSLRVTPVAENDVLAGAAEAVVDFKPEGTTKTTGRGARKYLRAQIDGGVRRIKGFEKALGLESAFNSQGAGVKRIAVPAKWAEIDQYGNIKQGQLKKIISYLRLGADVGYTSNRNANRRSRGVRRAEEYFMIGVGSEHATLSPGIYRVDHSRGGAPLMVIAFVRAANYRARFRPADIARAYVQSNASTTWQQALTRTLPFRR